MVKTGVLTKTRCGTKKNQTLQGHGADISDVEVGRSVYYSSSGKRKTESWKNLHVGGIEASVANTF